MSSRSFHLKKLHLNTVLLLLFSVSRKFAFRLANSPQLTNANSELQLAVCDLPVGIPSKVNFMQNGSVEEYTNSFVLPLWNVSELFISWQKYTELPVSAFLSTCNSLNFAVSATPRISRLSRSMCR